MAECSGCCRAIPDAFPGLRVARRFCNGACERLWMATFPQLWWDGGNSK